VNKARPILLAAVLSACSGNDANQIVQRDVPFAPPPDRCAGGGNEEHCVEFGPAERIRGHWITGSDVSNFWEEGSQGADGPGGPRTWLIFAAASPLDPELLARRDGIGRPVAIRIDFIGRRARRPGHYGNLGGHELLVIVDRIVSTEFVGPLQR
jgi:hypothetical protein